MLPFSGVMVCFVLFRFRLFGFTEAAALRSIVLRSPIRRYLTTVCLRPLCVLVSYFFVVVSIDVSPFPSIFCTIIVFFTLTDRASNIPSNIHVVANPVRGLLDRKRSEEHLIYKEKLQREQKDKTKTTKRKEQYFFKHRL